MSDETEKLPTLLSGQEIDAKVAARANLGQRGSSSKSDEELAEDALVLLKSDFPRIYASLTEQWGTPQGETLLDGLILDDRGNRQGFPPAAMSALLALQRVHYQQFGTFKRVDPWDVVLKR